MQITTHVSLLLLHTGEFALAVSEKCRIIDSPLYCLCSRLVELVGRDLVVKVD
jgi:hypothetical protein